MAKCATLSPAPVVALICFGLASCAVGPNFTPPPAPTVERFLSNSSEGVAYPGAVTDVAARWWEAFRSPHLNALIEDGLARNADLEAATAAIRVAQANAWVQRAGLFPVVGANFDASRQQVPFNALTTSAASGENLYSLHTAQVSVAFVPDIFGGQRRQIETSEALVDAQVFQREAVLQTMIANIALAAVQEASAAEQLAVTRSQVSGQERLLAILRRQQTAGQIAMSDVVAQETAVGQTRLMLAPLEKQWAQQRNILASLTGRFPADYREPSFRLAAFRMVRRTPTSLPADLVRQRPDIRAAEAQVQAANAQIGAALANRLPQLTLTGNVGSSATAIASLFTPGTLFWTIAGSAAQTIFDAGAREAKQRAAEATTDQAVAQYRGVALTAFQNVADVLRALQVDRQALRTARAAQASAERGFDLARKQVEQGQVSIPVLLVAQQAYLQTSLATVQAEAAQLADMIALFQALGGGWWNRPVAEQVAIQ